MLRSCHGPQADRKQKRTRLDDWLFWVTLIIVAGLFGFVIWRMQ